MSRSRNDGNGWRRASCRSFRGYSPQLDTSLKDLVYSIKAQGLEGLVAKRRDSRSEPGERSGAWQKMRVNLGQEFVIGGYTVGGSAFDALIIGYYKGDRCANTQRRSCVRML